MSEIKHEITTPDFERNERIKTFYERNKKIIEKLLEEIKNKLGEGATAEVYFLDSNEEICLKILKPAKELPYHVPLEQEMNFLSQLQNIDEEVRVPKPYLTADYSENGDENAIRFLLMEKLNALSIRDILEGKGELPAGFSIATFKEKISNFLEKMHEKNIYHRDLHGGNIMIDNKTGDLYVIDFGASVKGFGSDNPYTEVRLKDSLSFTEDEVNLTELCLTLKKYMVDK
jgi:serine/threonine protein kinase